MTSTAADALRELGASFAGELIDPAHPSYDDSRKVWNASIDRRPALIARCAGVDDIVAALGVARSHGLEVAVRSGGHSFPGHSVCDDGIVIDLSALRRVEVDPEARTARVDAGVLLGELDAATQAHGLVAPAGIVTHTGVAGLTLGGGIGWVQRKYGLTIDQLLSVELVTASGDRVVASEKENAELFWGLRGGGGNFGIVTSFEFRLNPLGPMVLAGPIFWPITESEAVLRFYREWIADAPDELMTIVIHRKAPPLDAIPKDLHGKPVVAVTCCYAGDIDKGEKVVAPLRSLGTPVLDLCKPKPFLDHQSMFDPSFPHGWWYYTRATSVPTLTDAVVDITVEHSMQIGSPLTSFPIWQLGGAITAVGEDDTAYSGRQAGHEFNLMIATATEEGFDAERDWVRRFDAALEPHRSGVYVNFLMSEGEDRVREAYGETKLARLKALKRSYDPDNVFHLNQNITP